MLRAWRRCLGPMPGEVAEVAPVGMVVVPIVTVIEIGAAAGEKGAAEVRCEGWCYRGRDGVGPGSTGKCPHVPGKCRT